MPPMVTWWLSGRHGGSVVAGLTVVPGSNLASPQPTATANLLVGYHLGWHLAVGWPLLGATEEKIMRTAGSPKTYKEKKKKGCAINVEASWKKSVYGEQTRSSADNIQKQTVGLDFGAYAMNKQVSCGKGCSKWFAQPPTVLPSTLIPSYQVANNQRSKSISTINIKFF